MATMKTTGKSSDLRYVVIMAGGRGERFWPVSREKTPKQLVTLLGDRSLLQQTVDRVAPLVPPENLLVITNASQERAVRRQLSHLPRRNIIAEPVGRDTAAAVALGAAVVGSRSKEAVMAVLPADHVIRQRQRFCRALRAAFQLAAREPVMVTLGIRPTEPATGYGYIRLGGPFDPSGRRPGGNTPFHVAEAFKEKPDQARAMEYVASGRYRWNAGMFVWSFATLTGGLEKHQPALHEACREWVEAARDPARLARVLARDYPGLMKISIDFALLEKATNVVCADAPFDWDDLGAWPALARHVKADADGNAVVGDFVQIDAAGNIVCDARSPAHRTTVAAVGLRDALVVLTDDVTLVADKRQAHRIRDLVRKLAGSRTYARLV